MANLSIQSIVAMAEQEANASRSAAGRAESEAEDAMYRAKKPRPLSTEILELDDRNFQEEAAKEFKLKAEVGMYQPDPVEASMLLSSLGKDAQSFATAVYQTQLG